MSIFSVTMKSLKQEIHLAVRMHGAFTLKVLHKLGEENRGENGENKTCALGYWGHLCDTQRIRGSDIE